MFVKVDRFTSNQDRNDPRPILYISLSSATLWQRKCVIFCDICWLARCKLSATLILSRRVCMFVCSELWC